MWTKRRYKMNSEKAWLDVDKVEIKAHSMMKEPSDDVVNDKSSGVNAKTQAFT